MYELAPRADVGGGALFGALVALLAFITAPSLAHFDFNIIFGALGVVLPFAAGYLPRKWKSIYMAVVGLLALLITATFEFLLTGTLSEATKSLAITMLSTVLVAYLADPKHPEERSTRVVVDAESPAESMRRR